MTVWAPCAANSTVNSLVAGVLLLVGLVWIGQGSGMVAGSAMSGSSLWAMAGIVPLIGGAAVGVREMTRKPVRRP